MAAIHHHNLHPHHGALGLVATAAPIVAWIAARWSDHQPVPRTSVKEAEFSTGTAAISRGEVPYPLSQTPLSDAVAGYGFVGLLDTSFSGDDNFWQRDQVEDSNPTSPPPVLSAFHRITRSARETVNFAEPWIIRRLQDNALTLATILAPLVLDIMLRYLDPCGTGQTSGLEVASIFLNSLARFHPLLHALALILNITTRRNQSDLRAELKTMQEQNSKLDRELQQSREEAVNLRRAMNARIDFEAVLEKRLEDICNNFKAVEQTEEDRRNKFIVTIKAIVERAESLIGRSHSTNSNAKKIAEACDEILSSLRAQLKSETNITTVSSEGEAHRDHERFCKASVEALASKDGSTCPKPRAKPIRIAIPPSTVSSANQKRPATRAYDVLKDRRSGDAHAASPSGLRNMLPPSEAFSKTRGSEPTTQLTNLVEHVPSFSHIPRLPDIGTKREFSSPYSEARNSAAHTLDGQPEPSPLLVLTSTYPHCSADAQDARVSDARISRDSNIGSQDFTISDDSIACVGSAEARDPAILDARTSWDAESEGEATRPGTAGLSVEDEAQVHGTLTPIPAARPAEEHTVAGGRKKTRRGKRSGKSLRTSMEGRSQ